MMRVIHIVILYGAMLLTSAAQDSGYVGQVTANEKEFITTQLRSKLWDDQHPAFDQNINKRYLGEPAVFLKRTTSREFYRNSRNTLRTVNLEHHVIKILNRQGVEDNSIFTYEHIESEYAFDVTAIRVISEDGAVREINIDSIVFDQGNEKLRYKNFVIPGLQPGDILDFYYYLDLRVLFPQQYSRIFDPVYLMPPGIYPVMDYQLNFTLGPSAFINVSANAEFPMFKEESIKVDKKTFTKFSAHISEMDASPGGISYYYPFRTLPSLKYQVFVGPYLGNSDIRYNIGGSLKLNTSIQPSRLQDYLAYMLTPAKDFSSYFGEFKRYLKRNGIKLKSTPKRDLALQYYEYDRIRSELSELSGGEASGHAANFTGRTWYVLEKLKIPSDVVLAFDRSLSVLEEAVLTDELYPMVRVMTTDTLYLDAPSYYSPAGEVGPRYESSHAYAYQPKQRRLSVINMPVSGLTDNYVHSAITLDLEQEASIIKVTTSSGHPAAQLRKQVLNRPAMFTERSESAHSAVLKSLYPKANARARILKPLMDAAEQRRHTIEALNRAATEAEGANVADYQLSVLENGSSGTGGVLIFQESYFSEDLKEDLGDQQLISLEGILPATQLSISDLNGRTEDLFFEYPESREVVLEVIIPQGYAVPEISWLNAELDNGSAYFRSRGYENNGKLFLEVSYGFYNLIEPSATQEQVMAILDAYHELRNRKLLFRKM